MVHYPLASRDEPSPIALEFIVNVRACAKNTLTLGVSVRNDGANNEIWALTGALYALPGNPKIQTARLDHQVPHIRGPIMPSFLTIPPRRTLFMGHVHLVDLDRCEPRTTPRVSVQLSLRDRIKRCLDITLEPLRIDAEPGTVVFVDEVTRRGASER